MPSTSVTSAGSAAVAVAAAVSPSPIASPGNGGPANITATPSPNSPDLPHDSKQGAIVASTIIVLLIAAAFVVARFYTRIVITRNKLGSSEWLVLVAWLFALGTTIPELLEVSFGMGAHIYDLTPQAFNGPGILEAQWISILFYTLSLTCSKLSILMLYIQLFYHSWIRPASLGLLAVVALSQIWVLYVIFSACTPLAAFWDPALAAAGPDASSSSGSSCHPQVYWLSNQYLLIATDFLVFLLPLPVVWTLKVRRRQKILLVFLFALGFFVCAISVIRIVLLMPLLNNAGADFTYNSTPAYYWTTVEINLAIMVACAITLKPLISRFLPTLLLSTHPYYPGGSDDGGGAGGLAGLAEPGGPRRLRGSLLRDPLATFGSLPSRLPRTKTGGDRGDYEDDDDGDSAQALHAPPRHADDAVSDVESAADKQAAVLMSKSDETVSTVSTLPAPPRSPQSPRSPRSPTSSRPSGPTKQG
ncbi:hypothetical protein SPI_03685 [Niveomyces insectorum RCEF 264]|uniref:Rhodopsin domain-containing protein n=1 Tax=Niveomyces insectorum RCEF 264 TaxID=1081102 RepID=A0A162J4D5_9HYPO|nr:hypothetical protein SPI_03685 [Niveomyces insectorum RCEF 264]